MPTTDYQTIRTEAYRVTFQDGSQRTVQATGHCDAREVAREMYPRLGRPAATERAR